jgi:PAS domain S-box-containing protein
MTKKPTYEQLEQQVKELEKKSIDLKKVQEALVHSERELSLRNKIGERLGKFTERMRAEEALKKVHCELELRVEERRAELLKTNEQLKQQIEGRKRIEEALQESEEKYRTVVENSKEGIAILQDDKIVYVNPRIERLSSFSKNDIFSRDFLSFFHPDDRKTASRRYLQIKNGKKFSEFHDYKVFDKKGNIRWVTVNSTDIKYKDKPAILVFLTEITERKQAEEALRESEQLYRLLAENVHDIIWTLDMDMNLTYVSPSVERMRGYSVDEVRDQSIEEIFTPDSCELIAGILLEEFALEQSQEKSDPNRSRTFEVEQFCKDGSTLWSEIRASFLRNKDGKPIAMLGITRDISERKKAEEEKRKLEAQLQQSQKMQAIGTLAGGIAHEFNNILWMITGNTELALGDIPEGSPAQYSLELVEKACRRAKDLVRQILSFSRQIEQDRKLLKISPIIKEALKLLRSSIPATIEIRQNIQTESDTILADPTQIHQVLMNLCTNSAHAMREKGGVLEVTLESPEVSKGEAAEYPDLDPGKYIKLTVSDTGHGMEPSVLDQIFDPFFTTKQVGEGTGMGLAVVHGIVRSHGGAVTVHSEQGKGATFHVFFPFVEGEVKYETETSKTAPKGNEQILFVDDEEDTVDMIKKLLERLGYQVESLTSSVEALDIFSAQPNRYDLVITDMTMPHMTGETLAKELLAIRPDIPIILCTGFNEMISEDRAKAIGIREFAMKPLRIRDLAKIIEKVLH